MAAFTGVEAAASAGFRKRFRGEPAESSPWAALSGSPSVGVGLGAATITGLVVGGWVAWPLGAFLATAAYVLASGIEMSLAERAEGRD